MSRRLESARIALRATGNPDRVEAPVTFKAYLLCGFSAIGGILFGYDSGYINGVMGMEVFVRDFAGSEMPMRGSLQHDSTVAAIPTNKKALLVAILSAGTFCGSLLAGDIADFMGRRPTILLGSCVFTLGVAFQIAASAYDMLIVGRFIAGLGVGFITAIIILYMAEIAPRKIRGALISCYQFNITLGLVIASSVSYGTRNYHDSRAYRIPIAIQIVWATILAVGTFFLPESPRYFVKQGELEQARSMLSRVRGQPGHCEAIEQELAEIIANHGYEKRFTPPTGYFGTWLDCFRGSIRRPDSNLRRTILGVMIQMMQQWTGINFIFYFGTTFFQALGTKSDPFFLSVVTTLVNVLSTPISFWTVERFGRRSILIWGAIGMVFCQFGVAHIRVTRESSVESIRFQVTFVCLYICFFASTWGPCAWVVVSEIFPLHMRSRGVALSTASNWLWNMIIALITPFMVGESEANLGNKVFFIWGSLCVCSLLFVYFLVPETKGLTLEQIDAMLVQVGPRASSKWKPTTTYAAEMGINERGELNASTIDSVLHRRSSHTYRNRTSAETSVTR